MRLQKNANFAYDENRITAEAGWTKWYDWNVVKRHTGIINIFLNVTVVIAAFIAQQYLLKDGVLILFINLIAALLVWLFVLTPIHEILHLLLHAGFRLDDKCIITIGKGTSSAIYNGKTTKLKQCISTVLPVIVLTIILLPITLFSTEEIRIFMIFLLVLNIYGSYTDIYILFYILKRINKKDIIFGLYRMENPICHANREKNR